jgi:hypothetical protein
MAAATMTKREPGLRTLEFHPLSDFPLLEGAEFDALVADIKANGLREAIVLHEGKILDGRNRYRALRTLGISPEGIRDHYCVTKDCIDQHHGGPAAYVISANIHRRHLKPEQKIEMLAKLVAAHPEKSDRALAKQAGVDHKTMAKARRKAEATGEASPVEKRVGADGKARKQPVKAPAPPPAANDPKRAEVIALDAKATGTERKLAQFLIDRPQYTAAQVAEWLDCSETRIKRLRRWAEQGFPGGPIDGRTKKPGGQRRGGDAPFEPPEEETRGPSAEASKTRDDIGPASSGEAERLRIRVDELQAEKRHLEIKVAGLESENEELKAERDRLHQSLAEAHAANLALIERLKAHVSVEPPVTFGDPGPIPESLRRDRVRS